ncbi:MAG TPA: TonB-dependent receptor [Acidobacteriaceae bacterium]
MRVQWVVFAVLPALAGAAGPLWAQSDVAGAVSGRVLGPDGRGLGGALVRMEDPATGEHSDLTSDVSGNFSFADVAPGAYRMRVYAEGLSGWEADNLEVGLGTPVRLIANLAPLTLHRTVLVDGKTAVRDADSADVSAMDLNELPNNSRHWATLAALFGAAAPGEDGGLNYGGLSPLMNSIAVDGTENQLAFRGRERGTGTGGNGFAVAQSAVGQFRASGSDLFGVPERGGYTTVTKSGGGHMRGQATFYDRGAIGQTYNAYDKVMEVEAAGTTVSATGLPVMYLNGQPVTYMEQPYHAPDRRQEWDVSAGGPIRRDAVTWFFAWQQHERNDPAVARASEPEVFFFPPSAPALTTLEARLQKSTSPIAQSCAGTGVPGGGSTAMAACAYAAVLNQMSGMLGSVPRSTRQTILFPKIDWRVNTRNQLVLQYNAMRRTSPHGALAGASETEARGSFGNSSTSDDAAVARWEWFPRAWLLNSARYQYSQNVLAQAPGTSSAFEQQFAQNAWGLPAEVSVDRSAGFSFGTQATANERRFPAETRQQAVDAVSWLRGRQALRFGYDYNHVTDSLEGLRGENGAYSYASVLDFVSDMLAPNSCDGTSTGVGAYPCYTRYRQTVGFTNWWFDTADYAVFAADEWKIGRGLTLTLGGRWEYERLPDTNSALVNEDIPQTARLPRNRDDFAPRAAFAWDVFGRGSTVLRGSYGLYYGRVPNATVVSALTSTGTVRSPRAYRWRALDLGAPTFPYVFGSNETPYTDPHAPDQESSAPDVVYFDRNFRHPQIGQAQVSLEQSLGGRTLLTLTGMATSGHDLTQFVDTNIDTSTIATMFYAVTAPGNEGNVGPLGKASAQMAGSAFPIFMPARFYYQRLNPAYGSVTDILSETSSSYRGAMVRLIRRMSRTLTVNAGYTRGRAIDNNQNEATFADRDDVYDPADLSLEHGTSNYDLRERVAGGMVLREPWRMRGAAEELFGGYSLAGAGEWRTGLPYTMRTLGSVPTPLCSYHDWLNAGGATGDGANCLKAVTEPDAVITGGPGIPIPSLGASLNGSGGEDLIPGIGRNTFRYPAAANLDLRLTKHVRLSERYSIEVLGEAFNALNHQNVTDMQTVGYRVKNEFTDCSNAKPCYANMANLVWQSGERPAIATTLVNGSKLPQYAWDPTAAFGNRTNTNGGAISRERQIQAGVKLNF